MKKNFFFLFTLGCFLQCESSGGRGLGKPPRTSEPAKVRFNTHTSWGSMEAGSNILYLTKSINAKVGEELCVWLPSGKTRGTVGPGGSYPEKYYNTAKEMRADKSRPVGSRAFALDTPSIFRYYDGQWNNDNGGSINQSVPFALYGNKILKIQNNGLKITLEQPARISVKNVRVTPDETKKVYELILNTKIFNAKDYGLGKGDTLWMGSNNFHWQPISPNSHFPDGWRPFGIKILGNNMVWASPPGTIPVGILPENGLVQAPNLIRDLIIVQPGSYEGMGFHRGSAPTTGAWGDMWQECSAFAGWTKNIKFINCKVYNPVSYAFLDGRVDSCEAYVPDDNIHYIHYMSWIFKAFSDTISNCKLYANGLIPGFEIERGVNGAIINCTSRNGVFAMNSSTNPTFKNNKQIITALSAEIGVKGNPPVFSVNNRIGNGGWDKPSKIIDHIIKYEGYPYSGGVTLRDFIIEGNGVSLINVTVDKPNITAAWTGNTQGAVVLYGGDDLLIDNMTVKGGKMAANWGCAEQTRDAAQFDLRGERVIIKNSRGLQKVVGRCDIKIVNTKMECPLTITDCPS